MIYCDSVLGVFWTFNDVKIPQDTRTLLLEPVESRHAGSYKCHGKYPSGKSFVATSALEIYEAGMTSN